VKTSIFLLFAITSSPTYSSLVSLHCAATFLDHIARVLAQKLAILLPARSSTWSIPFRSTCRRTSSEIKFVDDLAGANHHLHIGSVRVLPLTGFAVDHGNRNFAKEELLCTNGIR
jgi:hypothetical protein